MKLPSPPLKAYEIRTMRFLGPRTFEIWYCSVSETATALTNAVSQFLPSDGSGISAAFFAARRAAAISRRSRARTFTPSRVFLSFPSFV